MSETLQIWLFAGGFGAIAGGYIWQWQHRSECERKRLQAMKDITDLQADVKYLMNEVGDDHNKGLRHRTHFLHGRVMLLAQKLGMEAGDDD